MGVVYHARDRVLERDVALKLIRPDRAADAQSRQRFLREARSAATLSHPGIATVFEAGEASLAPGEAPALYIAGELVEGETLAARAARSPRPVEEVAALGVQIAEALGEAHDHGIVHRDIKPSNLMVAPGERVKVLDFGLARQRGWRAGLDSEALEATTLSQTAPGMLLGTPAYMAPEQVIGEPVDPPADVYALGCVLYELLAGRPPIEGSTTAEVLRRRLTERPRPLAEVRRDVPGPLAAVVARALDPDPLARFGDGHEMARALRAATTDTAAGGELVAPRPRRLRSAWRAALGAAALVAAVAWFLARESSPPPLAFGERDFVLVADVVNETDEPVFDLALKTALETDLRQSRYVNVLEASRVRNILRMMRLTPDTPVDQEVGRTVCRRAGAKALVVPTILRAGEAYQLQAALLEPSTSRVVDDVRVTARGREEVLLSAIDELTRALRRRLGESLASIDDTDPPFAEYTTSSLEALQMLEAGTRAWGEADHAAAERAFRAALEHDPHFATARGALGLLLIQFLGRPDEGRRMLARALHEGGDVSEREHLHLQAVHRQFVSGDLQGALEDYRFISELYPDYLVPYNNSGRILLELGRYEEARVMFEEARRVDPQSPVPLWNLWSLAVQHQRDPQRAEAIARALVELLPGNPHAEHALAWSLLAQRRFEEAEEGMKAVLALEPSHPMALANLGHLLMRRGAAEQAVELYRRALEAARDTDREDQEHLALCLGLALDAAGRREEARRTLTEAEGRFRARTGDAAGAPGNRAVRAALLAAAGEEGAARALLDETPPPAGSPAALHLLLARARALLGDDSIAIEQVKAAVAAGYGDPYMILVDPALAPVREAVEPLVRPAG
jgi:serine/threonine-protein kinase